MLLPLPPRSAPTGRRQLHRDKEVLFAGYKLPHPLEYRMLVKVQTRGRRTPRDVLDAALSDLVDEVEDMKAKFRVRLVKLCRTQLLQRAGMCETAFVKSPQHAAF